MVALPSIDLHVLHNSIQNYKAITLVYLLGLKPDWVSPLIQSNFCGSCGLPDQTNKAGLIYFLF